MATGITIERTAIRSTPGGEIVRSIPSNCSLAFTSDADAWLHVYSVDGQPQTGYCNKRSVRMTGDVIVTPPPVDPQIPPVVPTGAVHSIFVRSDGKISLDGLGYE